MEGDTTDMDEDEQMLMEEVIEADVDYEEIQADLHNRSGILQVENELVSFFSIHIINIFIQLFSPSINCQVKYQWTMICVRDEMTMRVSKIIHIYT